MSGFAAVAEIIAKGPPPEWLVPVLEHFSAGMTIEGDNRHFKAVIEQVETATDTLMKWLPMWGHMPWGSLKSPHYIQVIRAFLPELKKNLQRLNTKQGPGRKPDISREVCAAVVVEAWRRIHGEVKPRSQELYEACRMYWDACDGKPIGEINDIENWRWSVKHALAQDYSWVRETIEWYRTHAK
jgi:hypothetical protein